MEKAIPATVAPRGVSSGLKAAGFLVAQTRAASFWLMRAGILILYWGCLMLASLLPLRWSFGIARQLGRAAYWWRRRSVGPQIATLGLMLGLNRREAQLTARRTFELGASEDLDRWLYSRTAGQRIDDLIEIRGLENLAGALSRGKGAIICSGHCRSITALGVALGLRGYKINHLAGVIGRGHAIDHWFYSRHREVEEKVGIRFLTVSPTSSSVGLQAAKALQRNQIVNVFIDDPFDARAVEVNFLNGRVSFPIGPAVLAKATGAPLLNYYVYRPEAWVPLIAEFSPPLYASEDIGAVVQECASRLEEKIIQHPAGWYKWLSPKWRIKLG